MVNDTLPSVAFGNVGLEATTASRFLGPFKLNRYSPDTTLLWPSRICVIYFALRISS